MTDDASRRGARARFDLSEDAVVAAYVGRFQYPKNEDWILDVAIESRKRELNVQFIMCGEGPHGDTLRQRARDQGLDQIICWPGYIDPLPVYHASDLLLLPSSIEGFAYVAAEAASCGNAVLRTRTAGWHETVRPGETGRVVDIDRDAFVDAAVEMLANRAELRRMGAAGSAMVRLALTLDHQVERTLDIYRRAITESKATD
jgi:phosphatidylinositol alpha-1,6-mannosyltransferase